LKSECRFLVARLFSLISMKKTCWIDNNIMSPMLFQIADLVKEKNN